MRYLFVLLCMVAWGGTAQAALRTAAVEYRQGDVLLEGYLAYDDGYVGRRPGILVVHEWWGINDFVRRRVDQLAGLGYVAFAADIYGKGVRTTNPKEAGELAGRFRKDRQLLRARAAAGLDVLRQEPHTDPARLAAIGFCFGGTTVLELARSGADLGGVVSFHGGLDTPNPVDATRIKGRVLALHGADDPFVPAADVAGFEKEMRSAGIDWQLNIYGGAVHSFTNPDAGNDPAKGAAYNERAARRAWEAMRLFFRELFP
jgi:dienelactone hydrolase